MGGGVGLSKIGTNSGLGQGASVDNSPRRRRQGLPPVVWPPSMDAPAQAPPVTACVVLVRPQGPVNLGLVARLCANYDVRLRLVQPRCGIDDPQAIAYAAHARDRLTQASQHDDLAAAVADCDLVVGSSARRRRSSVAPARHLGPEHLASHLAARRRRRVALVFGNEATGLSRAELQGCGVCVHLPAAGPQPSYNLSHAVATVLYASLAQPLPAAPAPAAATAAQLEQLLEAWQAGLTAVGYFRRTEHARFTPKLRRMLQRWQLSVHDVHTLRGMLAHCRGDDRATTNPRSS